MKWLWFAGPLAVLGVYLAVVLGSTREDQRRLRELSRWLEELYGPLREAGRIVTRRVRALPGALGELVADAGGGARVADIVLVPKLGYLAVRAADGWTASAHFTVVMKLAKDAPKLRCRPLPVVDGRPIDNHGMSLDDEEFFASFLLEASGKPEPIRKWLSPELRAALLELPGAWLATEGAALTITHFGALSAEQLDDLVVLADAFFAEHGAGTGSLFPEEGPRVDDKPRPAVPKPAVRERAPAKAATVASKPAVGEAASLGVRLRACAVDACLLVAAAFFVALAWGVFRAFHPLALFNHPDPVVTQPWQGGFTTKGIGLFFVAEAILAGLLALELFLYATRGRTIGMYLVGLETRPAAGGGLGARLVRGAVVIAEPLRPARVQLGRGAADPLVLGQALRVVGLAALWILASVVLNARHVVDWF